jgi:ABC-2 type transport system ATP-binding protein
MSLEVLVDAQNLYRHYGERVAVSDLSLKLRKGEVLGLLGPNGAGKSSTLQMLSGNLAPSAGQISINGIDLLEHPKKAKRCIGYLPEQVPLYPDLSVDEYLLYCAHLHRIPKREIRDAIANTKQGCGLIEMGSRLIRNLSKGYRQRVGVAQALIHSPNVVILDEPTVGLDPIQIREVRALIRELGREHGVILSTHILPEVQAVCDRVQIVVEGRTVYNERIEVLDAHPWTGSFVVSFHSTPPLQALCSISGVEKVEASDNGGFRVTLGQPAAVGALVTAAVENDWGLRELTPERATLEQIFMDLVYREHGDT